MPEQTSKRVAGVYAEALYEAACADSAAAAVRADVDSLRQVLDQYPQFARLLADPELPQDRKEQTLRKTFEDKVAPLTLNFLLVLNQRWRLGSLGAILAEYAQMDNVRRLGRREVQVTSAADLDETMCEKIRRGIAAWGGFEPVLQVRHEPSLLGGLVIQIGDCKIDASVSGQLERLREQMKTQFQTRVTETLAAE